MRYHEIISSTNLPKFDGTITDEIYDIVLKHTGVGPFDGGCLFYATVLRRIFGGDILVVVANNIAQHAFVKIGNVCIDANGQQSENQIIKEIAMELHRNSTQMYCRTFDATIDLLDCDNPPNGVDELTNYINTNYNLQVYNYVNYNSK